MESSFLAKITSATVYHVTQITLMPEECDQSLISIAFQHRSVFF